VGVREDAFETMPDSLELLPQAQRQQDLDAIRPKNNSRSSRTKARLAFIVFDGKTGSLADDVSRQPADASSYQNDFHDPPMSRCPRKCR
jgi:hypothetical protein